MSKIIKAEQVRENPHLVEDIILDAVLLTLSDPNNRSLELQDSGSTYFDEREDSPMEELDQSIARRQAKLEEDFLRAKTMLSEAEEKSREIYEEAYAKGLRHGQSAGEAKVVEEAKELMDYIESLGQAISVSQEEIITSAEESIGKLALAIAGKIVRREIQMDESVVQGIVRDSLDAIKGVNAIKLKVNVRDMDRIRDCKEVLLQAPGHLKDFKVVVDPRIEQGECVVETDFGIVDARIDSQLQEIGRAFFGDTHV